MSRRVASDSENRLVRAAHWSSSEAGSMKSAKFFSIAVVIYLVLYGVHNANSREAYRTTADYYTHEFLGLDKPYTPEMYKVVKCFGDCPKLKPYALRSGTHIQGDRWKERDTEYFTSYSKCMLAAGEWVSGLKKGTPYWFACKYHD